jgi:hypothetical protein
MNSYSLTMLSSSIIQLHITQQGLTLVPAAASSPQLARVLLQLQHYGACIAVAKRALADAAAAGDNVWAVQLLQLQANALAAAEDAAAALTCLREGMAR